MRSRKLRRKKPIDRLAGEGSDNGEEGEESEICGSSDCQINRYKNTQSDITCSMCLCRMLQPQPLSLVVAMMWMRQLLCYRLYQ